MLSIKDPTGKLARWVLKLQQYDFFIKYNPGVQDGNDNVLSRRTYRSPATSVRPSKEYEDIRASRQKEPELVCLINYFDCGVLRGEKRFSK